jgi:hypothetical protein
MKIYLDNNLGVTNVEQEELTQDTYGYNILKVYIPNAVLTPYDTFTCYYGALLQNGRKVGWFAMEARTSSDADYEANYTLYKATLEQCVVSVEGKVYIGCQVLLGNSGNATLIKKNTAVVQFNVRKSVAINNDILVLDTDQTTTDVLESYKNLLENALTTYATKATTYTKTEVNSALALKADKSNTYTKAEVYTKTEVDGKLNLKADKSDTYTKTEVDEKDLNLAGQIASARVELDNKINNTNTQLEITNDKVTTLQNDVADLKSVQNVVEVVATYSALNSYDTTKLDANDKVQVIADETHSGASTIYNWDGTQWQYVGAFGGNSYTKAETYNKAQIDSALSDKADKSNTYTRAVIDSMILTLSTDKADKSDVYTKTEEDAKFEEVGTNFGILEKEVEKKADKADTYTKQEVNDKLDGYIKDNDLNYASTFRGKEVIVSTGAGYGSTTYGHSSIHIGNPRKPTCDYYFPEEKSGTLALTSDIPTVNDPTITFVQGTAIKGTIHLNQSENQTIALDAGGSGGSSVVANPTLAGTEADLTGLEVDGTKYKVSSGGGGSEVHLYQHNIQLKSTFTDNRKFVCSVISKSNAPFTVTNFMDFLSSNGFDGSTKLYPVGSTNICGIFYNNGIISGIGQQDQPSFGPVSDYTLTDVVIEIL